MKSVRFGIAISVMPRKTGRLHVMRAGLNVQESPPVNLFVPLNWVGGPIHEYEGAYPPDIVSNEPQSLSIYR